MTNVAVLLLLGFYIGHTWCQSFPTFQFTTWKVIVQNDLVGYRAKIYTWCHKQPLEPCKKCFVDNIDSGGFTVTAGNNKEWNAVTRRTTVCNDEDNKYLRIYVKVQRNQAGTWYRQSEHGFRLDQILDDGHPKGHTIEVRTGRTERVMTDITNGNQNGVSMTVSQPASKRGFVQVDVRLYRT